MTIQIPQDLAHLIENMVRTGRYDSELDVIRDALIRLRQARELTAATIESVTEPVAREKPLTKQTLLRHLSDIGLVQGALDTGSQRDSTDAPPIQDENEIISEVVIRERLIEWLVGFL